MHSPSLSHLRLEMGSSPHFTEGDGHRAGEYMVVLAQCASSRAARLYVSLAVLLGWVSSMNPFSVNRPRTISSLGWSGRWGTDGFPCVSHCSDRYTPSLHSLGYFNVPTLCDLVNLQWFILTKAQQARENMKRKDE